MQLFLLLMTLLTGLAIPLLPFSTGFFPSLGLGPLKLGHKPSTRLVEVMLLWSFSAACLWIGRTPAGWTAVGLAALFSLAATNFYPQRIFVDLQRPERLHHGLAKDAPVLAAEAAGEIAAYPLELIVPHHIINDVIGGRPILAAW